MFLWLGVTCFGGPIAHIGYFRDEFVVRRHWLDEQVYADLVCLCQFLPGPASSQAGFLHLTRSGFYQFLRDHGSRISPEEGSLRIKVFRAYNRFGITIIRMVEKAGINKAFAALPYVQDENIRDVLQLCIEMPYHRLRSGLQEAYPRSDCRRSGSRCKEELRRAAERSAVRVIVSNKKGMIGSPGIFVPRQYRQHAEDELRAQEVFEIAMRRLGADDRDAFFMQVVELGSPRMIGKRSSSFYPNSTTDTLLPTYLALIQAPFKLT